MKTPKSQPGEKQSSGSGPAGSGAAGTAGDTPQAIFDLAPIALAVADAQGNLTRINRRFEQLLGYEGGAVRGLMLESLGHPEDRSEARRLATACAGPKGATPLQEELRLLRQDGEVRWARVWAAALGPPGEPTRLTLLAFDDISERQALEEALRKSRLSFQTLAALAPAGIFRTDANNHCLYVSERWSEMTGVSRESALAGGWTRALPENVRSRVLPEWNAAVHAGLPYRAEHELARPDGQSGWLLWQALPEKGPAGEILGYVGTLTDITEQKTAEEQQLLLERRLQEAQRLESLAVLAGGVAHDFNNLLTGVLGNAALCRAALPPSSDAQHHLQQIENASLRAAELCKQMLAYSGRGRFVVENLDLNRILEDLASVLKPSLPATVVLQLDQASELPPVRGDSSQIRQAIMNLVINAGEAIGERRGLITVTTGVIQATREYFAQTVFAPDLPNGDYVFVEVGDNGCGMAPEVAKRIFDPFFSTKFVGRGLGLAAVLGIVRGHQGAIHVYSEEGRGSTFKLLLPCAEKRPAEPAAPPAPAPAYHGHGTVLVVDDEELIRSLATQILQFADFEVLAAPNGEEALRLFQRAPERIALVLLDLTMPVMDGVQVFRELRKIRRDVPVLLMSGFNEQEAVHGFTGRGLDGFLQKPFRPEALIEKIRSILA